MGDLLWGEFCWPNRGPSHAKSIDLCVNPSRHTGLSFFILNVNNQNNLSLFLIITTRSGGLVVIGHLGLLSSGLRDERTQIWILQWKTLRKSHVFLLKGWYIISCDWQVLLFANVNITGGMPSWQRSSKKNHSVTLISLSYHFYLYLFFKSD